MLIACNFRTYFLHPKVLTKMATMCSVGDQSQSVPSYFWYFICENSWGVISRRWTRVILGGGGNESQSFTGILNMLTNDAKMTIPELCRSDRTIGTFNQVICDLICRLSYRVILLTFSPAVRFTTTFHIFMRRQISKHERLNLSGGLLVCVSNACDPNCPAG